MLVLSRKAGERIQIGDNVTVIVQRISGNRVALGIEAPDHVKIIRGELERLVTQFDDPQPEVPSTSSSSSRPPQESSSRRGTRPSRLVVHRASA